MRTPMRIALSLAFLASVTVVGILHAATVCFKCHDRSAFRKSIIHQPVAKEECHICHNPHVARYKGLLNQKAEQLCYSCHQQAAKQHSRGNVHQPIKDGDCLACHAPHTADIKGLLNQKLADSCLACHTDLPPKFKHTHSPYAKGQCDACHRPHQSDNAYLLTKEPEALCFNCHQASSVRKQHPNYPGDIGACLTCHNPHGSERQALIRNVLHAPFEQGCKDCHDGSGAPVTTETCLSCHQTVKEQMATPHSHLLKDGTNGCLACHSPHAGDQPQLLKGREAQLCRTCHEQTLKESEASQFRHPESGACSNCHEPHGSKQLAMIKGDGNTVCTQCHETQGQFTHPIGDKVIDPRTGQSVTCVSCHYPMGTDFKFELKLSGQKDLCVLCHRAY